MSKFNTKKTKEKVENLAGGQAYKQSDEMAFVSLMLTSFVKDQFYRKSDESLADMKSLVKKIKNKEFLAKSAIFARDEFGMRSITHALAGELASEISGKEWSKNFYSKVVSRVDDMSEILSYYLVNKTDSKNPKFPNSIKKGFAKAFDKFDGYQLAKWRSENKERKKISDKKYAQTEIGKINHKKARDKWKINNPEKDKKSKIDFIILYLKLIRNNSVIYLCPQ
jgi:hypothetical protein